MIEQKKRISRRSILFGIGTTAAAYGLGIATPDLIERFKPDPVKDADELIKQVTHDDLLTYGLIPEFVGRIPVMVALQSLDKDALIRILTEPRNALARQFQEFFQLDSVELVFTDDALGKS